MKILITGGTGFVGSHVCRQLMAAGESVRLLVRQPDKAKVYYEGLGEGMPELMQGDITDIDSVKQAVDGCDAVVHTAAGTPMQHESLEKLFSVNVDGVKNVVDSALQAGINNIVCVSSITAIFNADGNKVTADAEPVPSSMSYCQSKVEAEYYLRGL